MSEEELQEETIEESQEEEQIQEEVVEEEDKSSIIDRIKEKVFGKNEEVEEEAEPEIPQEFLDVAKDQFSEDEIKKLAKEFKSDELKELVPYLIDNEEEETTEEEVEEDKGELLEVDEEKLKPYIEKLQKALDDQYSERINVLEERLRAVDDERVVKEETNRQEMAHTFFDKASKKLPVFGETEKLMKFPKGHKFAGDMVPIGSAYKARAMVYDRAQQFAKLGASWGDSLDDALAWYIGKHGEKEFKENLVKDLKQHEKRLSPRRSSGETAPKYKNEYEEKLALIEEAKRKAGIT